MRVTRTVSCLAIIAMSFTTAMGAADVEADPLERVIVVLNDGPAPVAGVASGLAHAHQGEVGFVYEHAIRGFSMRLPRSALQGLTRNPQVAYVEPDIEAQIAQTGTQPIPEGIDRIDADLNPPASPMDVDIAIIDTGIYIGNNPDGTTRSHLDLNLVYVIDCTGAIFYPTFGGCDGGPNANFQDQNGHGTHVAGIAAAKDNDIGSVGVAPGATLWSVKVLGADGTGFLGSILAGIDIITQYAGQIEVANMSLTMAGGSASLDQAIANSVNAGVVYVVAAGNSAANAASYSPAAHPDVISVSAVADFDGLAGGFGDPTCRTDVDDTLADFSNFGPAVDIAAPGVCIYSTYLDDGYAYASGTSMASPFVAGAVARYIAQSGHPTASRADVMAIRNTVIGAAVDQGAECGFEEDQPDGYPEPMLSVNGGDFGGSGTCGVGEPPPPPPPTTTTSTTTTTTSTTTTTTTTTTTSTTTTTTTLPANNPPLAGFTYDCPDLTCTFMNTSSDPDGDPLTYSWDFGDGATDTIPDPIHEYSSAGTYTVTLTANDGESTDSATQSVTVNAPSPIPMTAAVFPVPINSDRDAEVVVWITAGTFDGVEAVTVEGEWTYVDRRDRPRRSSQTGVTNLDGEVAFSIKLPKGSQITTLEFCVTNAYGDGYVFVPTASTNCWVDFPYVVDP